MGSVMFRHNEEMHEPATTSIVSPDGRFAKQLVTWWIGQLPGEYFVDGRRRGSQSDGCGGAVDAGPGEERAGGETRHRHGWREEEKQD